MSLKRPLDDAFASERQKKASRRPGVREGGVPVIHGGRGRKLIGKGENRRPYRVAPEQMRDGPWKRKLLREKEEEIARLKSERAYSKVRREYELQQAQEAASKAKAKVAGTIVYAPPALERSMAEPHTRGSDNKDEEDHDEEQLSASSAERDSDNNSGSDRDDSSCSQDSEDENSFTGFDSASISEDVHRDTGASKSQHDRQPNQANSVSTNKHSEKHNLKLTNSRKSVQHDADEREESKRDESRAELLKSRAKRSYLASAAEKAAKRQEAIELRRQQREQQAKQREAAIEDRIRLRKLMRKAKEPGRDGRPKLGRQGVVLFERAKKMINGNRNADHVKS